MKSSYHRFVPAFLLALLLGGGAFGVAVAMMTGRDGADAPDRNFTLLKQGADQYTLEADGAQVADVLERLSELSGVEIDVDSKLEGSVSQRLEGVSLEDLLKALTASRALTYEKSGDSYRLTAVRVTSQAAALATLGAGPIPDLSEAEASFLQSRHILHNTTKSLAYLRKRGSPAVLLNNAVIETTGLTGKSVDLQVPADWRARADTDYYIVKLDGPITDADRATLATAGAEILHYIPNQAYAVRMEPDAVEAVRALPGVALVEAYHPYYKISPDLLSQAAGNPTEAAQKAIASGKLTLLTFRGAAADELAALGGVEVAKQQTVGGRTMVEVNIAGPESLAALAHCEAVQWIEAYGAKKPMNDLANRRVRAASAKRGHAGLDGSGVIINVNDTGVDYLNPGFSLDQSLATTTGLNTRIAYYEARAGGPTSDGLPGDAEGHGTHVSGSILGNGALSDTVLRSPGSEGPPFGTNQFAGIAPGAQLVMLEDFNSFTDEELAETAYRQGARISNNSWGNSVYTYGALSAIWDALVLDADNDEVGNQEFIAFFAAGNDGAGDDDGQGGTPGTVGQPGNAKNVITIGASEQPRRADNIIGVYYGDVLWNSVEKTDSDWQIADFSSRGPVDTSDIRVKPDLVAPGAYVGSIQSHEVLTDEYLGPGYYYDYRYRNVDTGTNFAFFSGTSMATPIGAGSAALIYQYYTNAFNKAPSPALMKAMMVSGARMLNTLAYRYTPFGVEPSLVDQGWGLIDVQRAIDGVPINFNSTNSVFLVDQEDPLSTDESKTYTVTVEPNEGGLRVVLAWTDPAGTPGNSVQLVNDLDLSLEDTVGNGYVGNFFSADGVNNYNFIPFGQVYVDVYGDAFNNVEIINAPDLAPGTYTIRVNGYNVPQGPQNFAVVIMRGLGHEGFSLGNQPDIALDDNGDPVVAYSYDTTVDGGLSNLSRQIYVKRWKGVLGDDADLGLWRRIEDQWYALGHSMEDSLGISRTLENSEDPSVAVKGDHVYVAWRERPQQAGGTNTSHIFLRHFDGTNWNEMAGSGHGLGIDQSISFDAFSPDVGIMADGNPVVSWLQYQSTTLVGVRVAKWNGTNWVGLANSYSNGLSLTFAGNSNNVSEYLSMAINNAGNPVVAWHENAASSHKSSISVRRWNGASWDSLNYSNSLFYIDSVKVAASPESGEIYLAWRQQSSSPGSFHPVQIFAARRSGASWTEMNGSATFPGISAATNANFLNYPYEPDIGIGLGTNVFVSWRAGASNGNSILVRKWNAVQASWGSVFGAGDLPGIDAWSEKAYAPAMVTDPSGLPFITFEASGTVTDQSYVATYTVIADRSAPAFEGLRTAVGNTNGTVTLTWLPATDLSTTIYYRVFRSTTSNACSAVGACDAGNVFSNLIAMVTNGTTYTVTNLAMNYTWCFGVRAIDTNNFLDDNTVTRRAGPVSGGGDGDADCLNNSNELAIGTAPCNPDTDGDGMADGWEWFYSTNNVAHVNALAMDPLDNGSLNLRDFSPGDTNQLAYVDPDGDGASSLEEYLWYVAYTSGCVATATNLVSPDPTDPDTDGDILEDGWEMVYGFNPVVSNSAASDGDFDGLPLLNEYLQGTDPNNPDTDLDGLYDGSWYFGNPFGGPELFEGTYGAAPLLPDTDFDGLDDGVEALQGSDPIKAASIVSFLTDGDLYQLGWTNSAVTNFASILVNENFETPSRTNWTHNAPNGAMPFDFWHLSTAEPGTVNTNGVSYFNARSTNTAYRMANDPSTTNVNATYDIGGGIQSLIQNALYSPRFDATNQTALFVQWNEFFETEPNADYVTVQGRAGGNPNWFSLSSVLAGRSMGTNPVTGHVTNDWVFRKADLSRFAGQTNVQVRFLFSAQNAINNNYRGWWVDDVAVFGTRVIRGWVRDNNGKAIEKATVYVIGRGGVKQVADGQVTIPPGKVFAEAQTAQDGSYSIPDVFPGQVYVKALAPGYAAEFYNGLLFTGTYFFGHGLFAGVEDVELVSTGGYLSVISGDYTNAHFELSRGQGRSYLGVAFANTNGVRHPVYVDRHEAQIWNGSNTLATATNIAYLTATNLDVLAINRPDWETNALPPLLLSELAPGEHWVQTGTNLPPVLPSYALREGEKFLVNFTTNQSQGSVMVTALDGTNIYPVWMDGSIVGSTPLRLFARVGPHKFSLSSTNFGHVAPKSLVVVPGAENFVHFTSNDLLGVRGTTWVSSQDVFGNEVTGAVVYLNGSVYSTNETTPLMVTNLLVGDHYLSLELPGFRPTDQRTLRILSAATNSTLFVLADADADFDRVGDRTEIAGYTNRFLYARSDDPDSDGLNNRLEFDVFLQSGIRLSAFDADTDDDGMSDGDEVGYDGLADRFALSTIAEQAVEGTNILHSYFVGQYLAGIDNFGTTGKVVAAIECDRFEATSLGHSNDAMPSKNQALTVFQGIPKFVTPFNISAGHFKGSLIVADTRPDLKDTDGDTLWDGFEHQFSYINVIIAPGTSNRILDPIECGGADEDPDADGLSNYEEFLGPDRAATTNLDWSDPTDTDSDDDGMPDGWEYTYGFDPNSNADRYLDPDGDGLVNLGEFYAGSNPQLYDTDADGLPDGQEVVFGSDPQDIDTDNDGLLDGREVWDRDLDGTPDGGFFPNWYTGADMDNDGFVDGPTDWDTDGDGMPDGWEVLDSFGRIRSTALDPNDASDADDDPDGDGLSNLQEYLVQDALYGNPPTDFNTNGLYGSVVWDYGTDPFVADSDGDGMPDGWEALHGLHPMDPLPDFRGNGLTNLYRYCAEGIYELCSEGDADGDGLANHREFVIRYRLGASPTNVMANSASTDPWNPDTDQDGLGDGEEDRSFGSNPIVQDTDGDRLTDGVGLDGKYGEVWSTTNSAVTNHFDQALNDLWILEYRTDDPIPRWRQVIPSNSPPQGRWGAQATYNPVFERQLVPASGFCPFGHPIGAILTESVTIMDNRQLLIMGGRDGVTRYSNAWQFIIASNIWVEATNTPSLLGEVSEFGAAMMFGHLSVDDCRYFNPGTNGAGRPTWRPWMTHTSTNGPSITQPYGAGTITDIDNPNVWHKETIPGPPLDPTVDVDLQKNTMTYDQIVHRSLSFDYTTFFGGWTPSHLYIGGRTEFLKSQDDTNSFVVDAACTHFGVLDQWGSVSGSGGIIPQVYRADGQSEYSSPKRDGLKSFASAYAYRGLVNSSVGNGALTSNQLVVVFGGMSGKDIYQETIHVVPKWLLVTLEDQPVGYELDGLGWSQRILQNSPPARWAAQMVYEPNARVILLFGGFDRQHRPMNDLWLYDGADWTEITAFTSVERPQPRAGAMMAFYGEHDYDRGWANYNSETAEIVLFGGTDNQVYFDDLWSLNLSGGGSNSYTATWTLLQPCGESREPKPSPRAFANMVWAQNAGGGGEPVWPSGYENGPADGLMLLFGGRQGALLTGRDGDRDLVEDGTEYELGGTLAGRDPRVNRLVETNNTTETIPFAFLRMGSVPQWKNNETFFGVTNDPRHAIANFEAVSYDCGWGSTEVGTMVVLNKIPWMGFNLVEPDLLCETGIRFPTIDAPPWDVGVEAYRSDMVDLWYHQYSVEFPFNDLDEWELGKPDPSALGAAGAPPYAYSGRWCYGTDLDGTYPNNAQMELLSPLMHLTIPPVDATDTNYATRFNLVFHEWLNLADSNDIVRVEMIRPVTDSEISRRLANPGKPVITLVPNRNNTYNTTGQWRRVIAPIEVSANETNVYFKFFFRSDAAGNAGGWYIDDVAVIQGGEIDGTFTNLMNSNITVVLLGTNYNGQVQDQTFSYNGYFQFGLLPAGNYAVGAFGSVFPVVVGPGSPSVSLGDINLDEIVVSSILPGLPTLIYWDAVPGLLYRVDYSTDFGATWFELATVPAAAVQEVVADYSGDPLRWYRVVLLGAP
jgi:hypothetical protein